MTSRNFRENLFAENSGEVIVMLVEITHPQITVPVLLSSDNATLVDFELQTRGTISRGRFYSFMPMDVQLPEQGEDATSVVTITLSDVALDTTPILEASIHPAYVKIEIVCASTPDLVEVSYNIFRLTSADVQGDSVTLKLVIDGMAEEPYPADNFTPASFPGLWSSF